MQQNNKRRAPRRWFERPGWADFGDGQPARRCFLQDISAKGARLQFLEPTVAPENFILHLAANKSVARKCKVMWRGQDGCEIGVEFFAKLVARKSTDVELLSC
jgi:hypothetical protein